MATLADSVESRLDEALAEAVVPGLAVGAIAGDEAHVACRGVASVETGLAVDADTLFQIGSTAKTLTATALMRQIEDGRAALDDRVQEHLPEFRLADADAAARVTLRHLLTHTGGWEGDLFEDTGRGDDALARYVERMAGLRQLAAPGSLFSYSNTGFCVLGRVVEVLAGTSFEAAVRELVLEPLGMRRSCFFAEEAIVGRVAVGHSVEDGAAQVALPWALPRAWNPAGGLVSSIREQLDYARFHLGDGRAPSGARLLTDEVLHDMQRPHRPAGGGRATDIGLSWMLQSARPVPLLSHGGSTIGQESAFVLAPERGVAIVVLTNSSQGTAVHGRLVRALLDELVGPVTRPPRDAVEPETLPAYDGRYAGVVHDFAVEHRDGALRLWLIRRLEGITPVEGRPPEGPMTLEVYSGDRVRVADGLLRGAFGEFVRNGDGAVHWLRLDGQLHVREQGAAG